MTVSSIQWFGQLHGATVYAPEGIEKQFFLMINTKPSIPPQTTEKMTPLVAQIPLIGEDAELCDEIWILLKTQAIFELSCCCTEF